MSARLKVCTLDDVWEGEMRVLTAGDVEVLVVNTAAGVRAYHPRCPHQAVALIDGSFDDGVITCSAHRWRFDAATGAGVNPKRCALIAYPVEVDGDDVYVDLSAVAPGAVASLT